MNTMFIHGYKILIILLYIKNIANSESAFLELKQRLTSTTVLTIPNNQDPNVVYTDTSSTQMGCVLMHNGIIIAYAYLKLKPNENNYPTHDLELVAISLR